MMRALLPCLLLLAAACAAPGGEPEVDARAAFGLYGGDASREVARPFDETADATADIDAALARAADRGARVILVLGGNWCRDSRSFAWLLDQPEVAPLVAARYELVFVDVGYLDRNLEAARRFGVTEVRGTPLVLVVSADGALLNGDSLEAWRTASGRRPEEVASYFRQWAGE